MRNKVRPKCIDYAPSFEAHGYKHVRWVENASRGLRLVGFADEITRDEGPYRAVRHTGWFTDDDQTEKYRGVVYLLPSRGEPRYVFGYADPNNDDCALLCFGEPENEKPDAARAADRFAEIFAEEACAYSEAWQAGRRVEMINEEIAESRTNVLKIGAEMRQGRKAGLYLPTACEALRRDIARAYRFIQKLRKERDELIENFGQRPGFAE